MSATIGRKPLKDMTNSELAFEESTVKAMVKLGPMKSGTICSISVGDKTVVMDEQWARNARAYLNAVQVERMRRKVR